MKNHNQDQSNSSDGRPRRLPTLEIVAELAGVSRATVSRVVNRSPKVSPEVVAAVNKAISALGYVPNRAARTLVTRRTDTLVLIMHERPDTVFEVPFFANVLRGVNAALSTTDLQLVLLHARGDQQRERALRYVCNGHVDGALLISLHGDDPMPGSRSWRWDARHRDAASITWTPTTWAAAARRCDTSSPPAGAAWPPWQVRRT
jgi:hypothetical protein